MVTSVMDNNVSLPSVETAPRARGLPLLGNSLNMMVDPARYLTDQYLELGPVFHIQAGAKKYVVLAGKEANQLLAREDGVLFESKTLFGPFADVVGTDVLITAIDGEPHKHMRRMMRPGFSKSAAEPHLDDIIQVVNEYVDSWQAGGEIKLLESMRRIVVDQIGLITTHQKPGEYFEDILYYNNTMLNTEVLQTLPRILQKMPRFQRALRRMAELSKKVIAWHRDNPPGETREADLIDDVLAGKRPDGDDFTDADLLNMSIGPYVAGMDTLASTMAFFVYALAANPEVRAKCRAEVREMFAGGSIQMSDFRKIETLHAAALETLRLFPATPFTPRVAAQPFEFEGYAFPTGTELMFAQTTTHFLPENYEDPYKFDITRYTDGNMGRAANIFTPFTVGAHTCLGAGLAEVQMLITMAALLNRIDLEPVSDGLTIHTFPLPNPGLNYKVRVIKEN